MTLVFDISGNRCNNSCSFCATTGRKPDLNTYYIPEGMTGIVKGRMRTINPKDQHVILRGTEPLIRDDFVEIIRYAHHLGIKNLEIESNGRVFYYKDFCQKIKREGISNVTVYLMGPNDDQHEKATRVQGSFRQSVEGIKNLLGLGIKVKVLFMMDCTHEGCIQEYVPFIKDLKPTSVAFLYLDLENKSTVTVDQAYVQVFGREIRDIINAVAKDGIPVEHNHYEGSIDFTSFFDDLQDDSGVISTCTDDNGSVCMQEFESRIP